MSVHNLPPVTIAEFNQTSPEDFSRHLAAEPAEAARWITVAAEQGMADAQALLGQILLDGRGVDSDPIQARKWFRKAAEAGHLMGMNMLGRAYELGWGGTVDLASAAYWFRLAANQGLDWAMYNYANLLLHGNGVVKDEPQAFAWYQKAADLGHAKSLGVVGRFYEEGWLSQPDRDLAADYYRKSAEAGDFRGQYNHALILAESGDTDAAVSWMQQALAGAHLNFSRTMARNLLALPHGRFHALALQAFEKCCREGDADDYYAYAEVLLNGSATPANIILGKSWLRRAAESGHAAAQRQLLAYADIA